jgi:hypothetical protein
MGLWGTSCQVNIRVMINGLIGVLAGLAVCGSVHPPGPPAYNCTQAATAGAFDPIVLQHPQGSIKATFIRYGATLTHLTVPDRDGTHQVAVAAPPTSLLSSSPRTPLPACSYIGLV